MEKRIVVAIDGPAGAGKSTVARRLAEKLGILYIDSGAMYRAVGLWALRAGVGLDDAQRLEQLAREARIELGPGDARVTLNGEDVTEAIRTPEVSQAASRVSTFGGVRRAMVEGQRSMGARASVVMEGRDIGTVVFPEADIKIFLDADSGVRSQRRVLEDAQRGESVGAEEVTRQIAERDARDRTRREAPLMQAPDAAYLDTTGLSIDQVVDAILKLIRERKSNGKGYTN